MVGVLVFVFDLVFDDVGVVVALLVASVALLPCSLAAPDVVPLTAAVIILSYRSPVALLLSRHNATVFANSPPPRR